MKAPVAYSARSLSAVFGGHHQGLGDILLMYFQLAANLALTSPTTEGSMSSRGAGKIWPIVLFWLAAVAFAVGFVRTLSPGHNACDRWLDGVAAAAWLFFAIHQTRRELRAKGDAP
jgi:hypothetical protein